MGKGTLTITPADNNVDEWRIVAPQVIEVPATEPITVRVAHLAMHTVTGRVLDVRNHPEAGVTVNFRVSDTTGRAQGLTAVTGENGGYQLANIPLGYQVSPLSLEKAGYRQYFPPSNKQLTSAANGAIDDVVLDDALLNISAVDAETGRPIPNAFIDIFQLNSDNIPVCGLNVDRNGQGFVRLPPGQMTLLVVDSRGDYQNMTPADAMPVNLQEGQTTSAVLKLHKGLTVAGTVVDGDGKPAPAATFYLRMIYNNDGTPGRNDTQVQITSDQQGHFEFSGLPAGKGVLTLEHMSNPGDLWDQPTPQTIELPAKEPITVTVTRLAVHSVRGRVVDTHFQPVAGVTVSVIMKYVNELRQASFNTFTAVTGEDGHYLLQQVPVGHEITLATLVKDGYVQPINGTPALADNDALPDALLGNALLKLTVVDAETGSPIPNIHITIYHGDSTVDQARELRFTDQQGQLFYRTRPAQVTLLLPHPEYGYRKTTAQEAVHMDLPAGEHHTVVLKLHKGLTITGTAADAEGNPLAEVQGNILMQDGSKVNFMTDASGHFEAAGLPAGKGTITLTQRNNNSDEWERDHAASHRSSGEGTDYYSGAAPGDYAVRV